MKERKAAVRQGSGELANVQLGLDRIVYFSDAVMAIAITLLALDVRVPPVPLDQAPVLLPGELAAMAPRFTSLIISFVIVGVYWISHHRYFEFIRRYDRGLMLLNLLFLLFVVCVPFVTNLLGTYARATLAYIVYSAMVAAIGFSMFGIWAYATHRHRLVDSQLDREFIRSTMLRALFAPCVFLLSIPFALVDPLLAVMVWCLSPVITLAAARFMPRGRTARFVRLHSPR